MPRTCSSLTAALGLAALVAAGGGTAARADAEANYRCDDGSFFVATFKMPSESAAGSADLAFADGRRLLLPQAVSADGGRYVEGDTEFWIKGNSASFTRDGKVAQCETIE